MKYAHHLLVVIASLFALSGAGCNDDAKEEINNTFDAYLAALRSHDSKTALELTDERYFEDQQHLINAARSYSRDQVFRMRGCERATIIMLRNRFTKEEIQKLDGRGLEKIVIENADDDSDFTGLDLSITKITFRPPRATAEAELPFLPFIKFIFEFVQVDGKWKINPAAFDDEFDKLLEERARKTGMREDTILQNRESRMSGKNVGSSIWDPPK